MIHKAKDLSPEQKVAIESLLRRHVPDDESGSAQSARFRLRDISLKRGR